MDSFAGSYALLGARPAWEASSVTRLRDAGAILWGKTNMNEWAGYRSTNSADGWNARDGQTIGIYYLTSSPEGGSSGSYMMTAFGFAFAVIGTEVIDACELMSSTNN